MQAFIDGLSFPLRAIRFIASQPMLWRYIVIPIALNILVGFVLYATLLPCYGLAFGQSRRCSPIGRS